MYEIILHFKYRKFIMEKKWPFWERKDNRLVHLQENSQLWKMLGQRWKCPWLPHLQQHSRYSSPKPMNNGLTGREEGALRGRECWRISHRRGRPPQVIADDRDFSPDPHLPSAFPVEEPTALAAHAGLRGGDGSPGSYRHSLPSPQTSESKAADRNFKLICSKYKYV